MLLGKPVHFSFSLSSDPSKSPYVHILPSLSSVHGYGWTAPSPTPFRQHVNPLTNPSRPGETLPAFPAPTHINNPQTIASTIGNIPPSAPNHHPQDLPYPKRPYDANNPLRSLIATAGGDDNYHPSGHRGFTEREFACLQTFPRGEWC